MHESPTTLLRIGDWRVDPAAGEISRAGETVRLETRTMRMLVHLAARAGNVVSIDELLDRVWTGVIVTPDSVYQAVTALRRSLGDDSRRPAYIATVPRLGYRMVAAVGPWDDASAGLVHGAVAANDAAAGDTAALRPAFRPVFGGARRAWLAAGAALVLTFGIGSFAYLQRSADVRTASDAGNAASLAVLPFLDLTTQEMNEEYFADGLTEELIDDIGAIPGMRIPGATSSFLYKDTHVPVAEIAQKLGVAYIMDGSVRKSGTTVRVAARLVRADDGYVAWSEIYDRPAGDVLAMQKDVAALIAKRVRATFAGAAVASAPAGAR